ncbi:MAG: hypothetical protein ACT443_02745 [Gemmatimonadota bacterium]
MATRAITMARGAGFFATLVVAWYHGEKGQQRVSGIELLMLAGIRLTAIWVVRYGYPYENYHRDI